MSEVSELFEYRGTCLECGATWTLTKEQIEVARMSEIAYSPCCEKPATIIKLRGKHERAKNDA